MRDDRPTALRVWAPDAERVEVVVAGRRCEMERTDGGWWSASPPEARPGADYAFVVDGGDPVPDPRSPWQPAGVHGASRIVDHSTFAWTDGSWQAPPLASAIVYELHVGTFTAGGTFDSAIEKLDPLVDLGVTHVELMPVQEFDGTRGWGYDGVDLYAPHHAYGGPDGLKRLVDACHARGLAVLLDVVYNHLGPAGNYLAKFGPYFTDRYATPWGPAVHLDGPGSDEVRRFLCDNARAWLEHYHFDGLRVDAVHALHDGSAVHFLEQLAEEVERLQTSLGRRLVLVAESDLNDPRIVRSREAGGYGFDAQWSDDFHHALHSCLTGERSGYYEDFGALADVAKALRDVFVYDGRRSKHRRRRHGRPVGDLPRRRFLGYLQNHDQIGNRARGERSAHLLSAGRLKIAAALVLTSPFVPMLFQGEEWGASSPFPYFCDFDDPELARAVREGRRSEFAAFGWDPAEIPDPLAADTFERAKLAWEERERTPHAELLDWHRRLIRLRRERPDLGDDRPSSTTVRFDEDACWLTWTRGSLTIACNLAIEAQEVPIAAEDSRLRTLLASDPSAKLESGRIRLPPDSVAVVARDDA
jgi:maltooligosyltrehalose trehalohydrolase